MKTYIRKNTSGFYVEYPDETSTEELGVSLGETYLDFLDGKWILLSNDQKAFHTNNPKASVRQVINMNLNNPDEPDFEDVFDFKLKAINKYDSGINVNSFNVVIGGNTISAWFTPEVRSNYKNSIEAAELVGVDTLSLYINDTLITLPTATAKLMLAQIQLYADQCFIVTKQHKNALAEMNTIEEIRLFDITLGYPEKLTFSIDNI